VTESDGKVRVTVTQDGPYMVTGGVKLSEQIISTGPDGSSEAWIERDLPAAGPRYALCRCGQSSKKPFCDGTHVKVGFDGTEVADRSPFLDQAKTLDGPSLALLDVESLCAFARFCDPNGQVWSQVAATDDPDVHLTFIRQVQNCPSGRLVAWDKASGTALEPELAQSIGLIEDPAEACSGPIWLRGGIALIAADGKEYEVRNRVTVCRCGESKNKPFCDGAHAAIKFHAK
jgi:CDGSH-type Zn-finger protein